MSAETSTIDIPTADGTADAILAVPNGDGPWPGVLVYMDAFGPRPRLVEMAARIASEGYVVVVPNVFYRHGRAPVVDLPDLSVPENRSAIFEKLGPVMSTLTPELAMRDAGAYLDFLADDDRVTSSPVGAVGYCMGGALALRTAARFPNRVAAVASYHGGRLATDAPDSPHRAFGDIRAEVYVGHADNDGSMPPEQQELVAKTLEAAGVSYRAELYEGAPHGFTMADTAMYDEAATERHWDTLLDLFARTLR
ncbi:MAG: dienelactone hydrolase family protein [Nocardioides sp.]